jgi:hypothetical protein
MMYRCHRPYNQEAAKIASSDNEQYYSILSLESEQQSPVIQYRISKNLILQLSQQRRCP